MITDVVVVPGAPLLLPEYQGRVPAAPGLLESCVAAVRDAVATAAHVVVVHATDREPRSTRPAVGLRVADHLLASTHLGFEVEHVAVPWDAPTVDCIDLGRAVATGSSVPGDRGRAASAEDAADHLSRRGVFASARDAGAPGSASAGEAKGGVFASARDAGAPGSASAGEAKGRVFASTRDATDPTSASETGPHARVAAPGGGAKTPPTTMLVVADGSARRTEKAPGHLDPRSHEVDDAIVAALRGAPDGGLDRLLDLDADLCADLIVAGRAPLQVLAAAAGAPADAGETTAYGAFEVVTCEVSDPFGVLYVVAHLARTG